MEMTEAAMMERLNPILDPAFLREVAQGIRRTAENMRDPASYEQFFHSPAQALVRHGTPGVGGLPEGARLALDETLREARQQIPPPPGFDHPGKFEYWLKCVLCVIALTVVLILGLIAIGVMVVVGVWLAAQLIPPIGAIVTAVMGVILGMSIPGIINAISALIGGGIVLAMFCVGISVALCPCKGSPQADPLPA